MSEVDEPPPDGPEEPAASDHDHAWRLVIVAPADAHYTEGADVYRCDLCDLTWSLR